MEIQYVTVVLLSSMLQYCTVLLLLYYCQGWTLVHFATSNPTQYTNSLTQSNPIQSMMCVHVPSHIHSNPSNPRQGKQSVQHFELMYAVNEVNNDYSNKKAVLSQR